MGTVIPVPPTHQKRTQGILFIAQVVDMGVVPPKTRRKVISADTLRKRIYRAKLRKDQRQNNLNSGRVAACRARMSTVQRESHNNEKRQFMRRRRATLSHAEKDVIKNLESAGRKKRRKHTCFSEKHNTSSDPDFQPDDDTIDECKMEALRILHRTIIADKEGWHRHCRKSSKNINICLGFPRMQLSPRATKTKSGYICFETYHNAMAPDFKEKVVPKFSCAT